MFNLFVTGQTDAWDRTNYEFDRSRFLEYTSDDIAARFKELNDTQISALKKLPCLFAYEGKSAPMRVGRLTSIRQKGRSLLIEYEIDPDIQPIPYESIKPIQAVLDIRNWELNRTHWAIKDGDLFERLRAANLLPAVAAEPPGAKEALPPLEPARREVSTVNKFIETVLGLDNGGKEVFYRGHSNKAKYRLAPSLFRRDDRGNYKYLDVEDRLYRELLVSNSSDFQGDIYTLDRLVRMQHYSLPTRLLDITSNPLIALYFACRSSSDTPDGSVVKDDAPGEVIVFAMDRNRVKYFDSDTASCIANLARLPKAEKDKIDYNVKDEAEFNEQLAIKRLLHFVKEEKPFFEPRIQRHDLRSVICVKSKRTNNRISFQSGAFLLFGQDAVLDERGTPEIHVERIAVTDKANIRAQLDLLNINESTVFPYIENSARYVAQKYSFRG